ncbi:hypothetical protein [uncultured Methanobrevibacter sp.]|uniref:hypothetical protein n=1 Tax=uncultured Methanobrevibacter sp. TaxID=253161 RepID=UPI0026DF985C|nr:hypothetical protein [uncultured Methanobrevibacter sp.]
MNWDNILFPADIGRLTKKEKTIYVFVFAIIPITFILSFLLYVDYPSNMNTYVRDILLVFPFIFLFLGIISPVVFHNIIVKKVKYFSDYHWGNTYQYGVLIFSLYLLPAFISGGLVAGYVFDNIVLGVGISLAFTIPLAGELLRNNVFNDESCNLDGKVVMGYEPGRFLLLSTFIGLYGYILGFRSIDSYNTLIWIALVFLFQLSLLFPDKVNKIFPLEIRTKQGHFTYLGTIIVLFLIFVFKCQNLLLGIGVKIINLSFRNILCWIIGVITAIILLKKYKDVWK